MANNQKEIMVSATGVKQWFPVKKKWIFDKQRYVKAVDDVDVYMYLRLYINHVRTHLYVVGIK